MQNVKFVHCSDLHLETPFKGLSRRDPEHAERQKKAAAESFARIVDLCISEEVDFLIISGDVYDSENRSVPTQINFAKQLRKLDSIPVYLVCGNHDPLSQWLPAAKLPGNVHQFSSKEIECVRFTRDGERIADIYGTSFETKLVKDNLAAKYELSADRAPVNIAVLHGTVGAPGSHQIYAQFSVADVEAKGFDYWALGHIHKRQNIRASHPAIVYPGNPQGRDFGETGAKGCVLVEIKPGSEPSIEFRATQTIRFEVVEINLTDADDMNRLGSLLDEAREYVAEYDPHCSYVYRIVLSGRTPLHTHFLSKPEEIDSLIEDLNSEGVHGDTFSVIDRIDVRTTPDLDLDAIRTTNDFSASVLNLADSYVEDRAKLEDLFERIDSEMVNKAVEKLMVPPSHERMLEILNQSTMELLTHLVEEVE